MKLLYVVRGLNQSSGTTHAIIPMAEEMARRGHQVSLFAVRKPKGTLEAMPDQSLVQTRMFEMSLPMDNPGVSFGFARAMMEEVGGFDVVHIQAVRNYVTWQAMRCARKASVPYIVAPQGSYDSWVLGHRSIRNSYWDRAVEIPLLNQAACIQCLTAREEAQVKAMGITSQCVVIPNGVAVGKPETGNLRPDTRAAARKALGVPEDATVILFLSRVDPKKGLDLLIRAFALLRQSSKAQDSGFPPKADPPLADIPHLSDVALAKAGSPFQVSGFRLQPFLLIAGSDAGSGYAAQMKALAKELGIADGVRFLGEVKGEIKERVLAAADVFALTSYSEGLPVAVLEAMAAGLPVVVTDSCNLPEVVQAGAGRVIRPEVEPVATALTEMIRSESLRVECGKSALRLVRERFAWSVVVDRLIDVYGRVCEVARR